MTEWTLSSLHLDNYALHYEAKVAPKADRCCSRVRVKGLTWPRYNQCTRQRGYGPEKAYCKQHDPASAQNRRAKAEAKWDADWQKRRLELAGIKFFEALCKIADGDNDPRQTALEAIKDYRK